jgi:hypothetical protein
LVALVLLALAWGTADAGAPLMLDMKGRPFLPVAPLPAPATKTGTIAKPPAGAARLARSPQELDAILRSRDDPPPGVPKYAEARHEVAGLAAAEADAFGRVRLTAAAAIGGPSKAVAGVTTDQFSYAGPPGMLNARVTATLHVRRMQADWGKATVTIVVLTPFMMASAVVGEATVPLNGPNVYTVQTPAFPVQPNKAYWAVAYLTAVVLLHHGRRDHEGQVELLIPAPVWEFRGEEFGGHAA